MNVFSNGIVLYGAGKVGSYLSLQLKYAGYDICAFVDNDTNKQGEMCNDIPIMSFEKAFKEFPDALYVLSYYYKNDFTQELSDIQNRHSLTANVSFCRIKDLPYHMGFLLPSQYNEDANYCIKRGYFSNINPFYYLDKEKENDVIWQPYVYEYAGKIAKKFTSKYIIDIGSGNGLKLKSFQNCFSILALDYGDNEKLLRDNIGELTFISTNLEEGIPYISDEILCNATVIFSDVIEHIIDPGKLLFDLSIISKKAHALIISTPDRDKIRGINDFGPPENLHHVREWNIHEFEELLNKFAFSDFIIGHTLENSVSPNLNTILTVISNNIRDIPHGNPAKFIF